MYQLCIYLDRYCMLTVAGFVLLLSFFVMTVYINCKINYKAIIGLWFKKNEMFFLKLLLLWIITLMWNIYLMWNKKHLKSSSGLTVTFLSIFGELSFQEHVSSSRWSSQQAMEGQMWNEFRLVGLKNSQTSSTSKVWTSDHREDDKSCAWSFLQPSTYLS